MNTQNSTLVPAGAIPALPPHAVGLDAAGARKQQRRLVALAAAAFAALVFAIAAVSGPLASQAGAAEPVVIIDVRTAEEFAAGHIEGAINIPLNSEDFIEQMDALDRGGEFILHCGTGARADRVANWMAEQGFTGLLGSYSLEEALDFSGRNVIGDLTLADAVNPTRNADVAGTDGPPTCALTGEDLFGLTRP